MLGHVDIMLHWKRASLAATPHMVLLLDGLTLRGLPGLVRWALGYGKEVETPQY